MLEILLVPFFCVNLWITFTLHIMNTQNLIILRFQECGRSDVRGFKSPSNIRQKNSQKSPRKIFSRPKSINIVSEKKCRHTFVDTEMTDKISPRKFLQKSMNKNDAKEKKVVERKTFRTINLINQCVNFFLSRNCFILMLIRRHLHFSPLSYLSLAIE